MKEIWKDVEGYKGHYQISSEGRVKSLARSFLRKGYSIWLKERILKPGNTSEGHLMVNLCKNGKCEGFLVHRLVLEAFIGHCPKGQEARHFPDPTPSNNRLTNLQWGTKEEQYKDRLIDGSVLLGERAPNAKMTTLKALEARKLRRQGWTYQKLAERFQVNSWTIWHIVNGTQWRHIEELETGKVIELS